MIYTTPLKALSNQKLFEFRRLFGTERVGLQTGDGSLNAEGDVVVMTTEVMRNIMYRTAHNAATGGLQPRECTPASSPASSRQAFADCCSLIVCNHTHRPLRDQAGLGHRKLFSLS